MKTCLLIFISAALLSTGLYAHPDGASKLSGFTGNLMLRASSTIYLDNDHVAALEEAIHTGKDNKYWSIHKDGAQTQLTYLYP